MVVILIILFSAAFTCKAEEPKPEFFGVYLVADGKLIEPSTRKTTYNYSKSYKGIKDISGCTKINDKNFYIIFYRDPNVTDAMGGRDYNSLTLSKLAFKNDLSLWGPETSYKLRVAPVKDTQHMYKIVHDGDLPDGIYAIHYIELGPSYSDVPVNVMIFTLGNPEISAQAQLIAHAQVSEAHQVGEKLTGKVLGFTTQMKVLNMKVPVDWSLRATSQEGNKVIGVIFTPPNGATMFEGTYDGRLLNFLETTILATAKKGMKPGDKITDEWRTEIALSGEFSARSFVNGKLSDQITTPRNLIIPDSMISKYDKDNVMVVGYTEKGSSKFVYTFEVKEGRPVPSTLKENKE